MPNTTVSDLESLISCHPDPDRCHALVHQHWEAGDFGSKECRHLLSRVRERRKVLAEERRRLAEEFDRTEPAADGVEAPEDGEETWVDV